MADLPKWKEILDEIFQGVFRFASLTRPKNFSYFGQNKIDNYGWHPFWMVWWSIYRPHGGVSYTLYTGNVWETWQGIRTLKLMGPTSDGACLQIINSQQGQVILTINYYVDVECKPPCFNCSFMIRLLISMVLIKESQFLDGLDHELEPIHR